MRGLLRCVAAAVLTLGLSVGAFAQDKYTVPDQKIVGAEKPVPLGDIVFLSLSKVDQPPAGYTKYNVTWKVIDGGKERGFRVMPDGSIFFGSGLSKRSVTVLASVSYLYTDKKDGQIVDADVRSALLSATLQLGDGPAPPPDPQPNVDPVFPDGKYKLSAAVWKLAKDKVPADGLAGGAALAQSFKTMQSQIAAGRFQKVEDVLKETTLSNRKALDTAGVSRDKWDAFFSEFQEVIYKLYTDKKVANMADFATAWGEIAAGLEQVKPVTAKEGK